MEERVKEEEIIPKQCEHCRPMCRVQGSPGEYFIQLWGPRSGRRSYLRCSRSSTGQPDEGAVTEHRGAINSITHDREYRRWGC